MHEKIYVALYTEILEVNTADWNYTYTNIFTL